MLENINVTSNVCVFPECQEQKVSWVVYEPAGLTDCSISHSKSTGTHRNRETICESGSHELVSERNLFLEGLAKFTF